MQNVYKGLELLGLNANDISLLVKILDNKLFNNNFNTLKYKEILSSKKKIVKDILSGRMNLKKIDKIIVDESMHFFSIDNINNVDKLFANEEDHKDVDIIDNKINEQEIIDIYINNDKDRISYTTYKNRLLDQNRVISIDSLEGFESDLDINTYLAKYKHLNINYLGRDNIPFIYKIILCYNILYSHIQILKNFILQSEDLIKNSSKIVELLKNAAEEVEDFKISTETTLVSKEDANERIKNATQLLITNIKDLIEQTKLDDINIEEEFSIERDFSLNKYLFI